MLSARTFDRTLVFQGWVLGFSVLASISQGDSVRAQTQPNLPLVNDVHYSNEVGVAPDADQIVEAEPDLLAPPVYGGSLWERPNFTGDWLGSRSLLAEGGFKFTGDFTNYYQGVVNGGRNQILNLAVTPTTYLILIWKKSPAQKACSFVFEEKPNSVNL